MPNVIRKGSHKHMMRASDAWLALLFMFTACHNWAALSRNDGKDGGGADGGTTCLGCVDPNGGPYNYAFVTSKTYVPGSLGGLDGADAECQTLAGAVPLPGHFKAWLATSTVDAKDRLVTPNGTAARGWIRPDGRPFADSIGELLDGQMYFPLRLDESGNDLIDATEDTTVATGTEVDGTKAIGNTSADWTSSQVNYASGDPFATNIEWTGNHGSRLGTSVARFYCFGVDHATPLAVTSTAGRLAFLSNTTFVPTTEADADSICIMEAHNNGRTGDFRALLSSRASPATLLYDLAGPTWVRLDGIPWLAQASDLAQGKLLTTLNVQFSAANQPAYAAYAEVWTGSATPGLPSATAEQDCSDWNSSTGSGTVGWAYESNGLAFLNRSLACNDLTGPKLYCLQR